MAGYYVLKRVSIENVIDPISRRRRRRRRRIVLRLSERLETALFKIRRLLVFLGVFLCILRSRLSAHTHR